MNNPDTLIEEAKYLYSKLFPGTASSLLIERYVLAHQKLPLTSGLEGRELMTVIVAKRLNVESLEFVLRLRSSDNVLTRKVQVLYYLAESERIHWEHFFSKQESSVYGYTLIFWSLLRAVKLWVQGQIQLAVYNLA
jgi:hypothetical protein